MKTVLVPGTTYVTDGDRMVLRRHPAQDVVRITTVDRSGEVATTSVDGLRLLQALADLLPVETWRAAVPVPPVVESEPRVHIEIHHARVVTPAEIARAIG